MYFVEILLHFGCSELNPLRIHTSEDLC